MITGRRTEARYSVRQRRGGGYSDVLVAMVCHDAILGMQRVHEVMRLQDDDYVITGPMASLHPDLRDAAVEGVARARRLGTSLSARDHHSAWAEFLGARGWRYGPVRDPAAKVHPNLTGWDQLPPEQRDKDRVFLAIVLGMTLDVEAA